MGLSNKQILFKRDSEYDTYSEFIKDFPMFKYCKKSIPPFILPNTLNGACVIFGSKDKSQFIYKMTDHSISLLGPSVDLFNNINDISWIIKNIFILNVSSTIIKKNKGDHEIEYSFNYENCKYVLTTFDDELDVNINIKKI